MSKTSCVKKLTSTTPTIRRCSSTSGNARNLWSTNASHASSNVAVCGIATTRGTMMSRRRRSSAAVSSRRVGKTPTSFSSVSTT